MAPSQPSTTRTNHHSKYKGHGPITTIYKNQDKQAKYQPQRTSPRHNHQQGEVTKVGKKKAWLHQKLQSQTTKVTKRAWLHQNQLH